jgi:hypothetical protein
MRTATRKGAARGRPLARGTLSDAAASGEVQRVDIRRAVMPLLTGGRRGGTGRIVQK